jgi:hypothetical protein
MVLLLVLGNDFALGLLRLLESLTTLGAEGASCGTVL